MFDNADFYPTPPELIKKMLQPWLATSYMGTENYGFHTYVKEKRTFSSLSKKVILEPNGGKGDILDFIVADRQASGRETDLSARKKLYTIESDPQLVEVLRAKDYRVIGNDFLAYHGDLQFDLIVMNPPFSSGVDHVLHAWELVCDDGDVVALLNAENLLNPRFESYQHLLSIIERFGDWEELGPVFEDAERKTKVNTALIRLHKPKESSMFDFDFGERSRDKGPDFSQENLHDQVAMRDVIGNMMLAFDKTKTCFVDYLRARDALSFYGADIKGLDTSVLNIANDAIKEYPADYKGAYNEFIGVAQGHIWRSVIQKLDMQQLMTHQVRSDFDKFAKHQGYMDFNKQNVAQLVGYLVENKHTILEQAIVQVFDIFTSYHKENRLHVAGWRTNDTWKVNRKVILPNWVKWGEYMSQHDKSQHGDRFGHNYYNDSKYSDIDKALCYITGDTYHKKHEDGTVTGILDIRTALDRKFTALGTVRGGPFDNTCESHFFHLKFHKSGTLHLTFKSEKLWEEFNLRACAGKNFLPPNERQAYERRARTPYQPAPAGPIVVPSPPPRATPTLQLSVGKAATSGHTVGPFGF